MRAVEVLITRDDATTRAWRSRSANTPYIRAWKVIHTDILYHGKILFSIFLRLQQVAKVSLNGVVIDTASSVREVYTLGRSGIFRLSNTFVTSGLRLN